MLRSVIDKHTAPDRFSGGNGRKGGRSTVATWTLHHTLNNQVHQETFIIYLQPYAGIGSQDETAVEYSARSPVILITSSP